MAGTTLKDRMRLLLENAPRGTQAALARACNVKPPSVNAWISGETQTIEGENLLNAARFFNVNPEWLATGRGRRERFTIGESPYGQSLGESVTNGLDRPPSHPLTLDPEILHEAMTLLVHDEQQAGEFTPRERTMRLADLYARVAADGGRLTREHNAEFVAEVRSRAEGVHGGNELAGHRTKPSRARAK